jgi:hypothetical protein
VSADRDKAGGEIARELCARLPRATPWLAGASGLYEEDRLGALVDDLESTAPSS